VHLKMSIGRTSAVMSLAALVLVLPACSKSTSGGSSGLSGLTPSSAPVVPSGPSSAGTPTATATVTSTGNGTATPPHVVAGPKINSFVVMRAPACPVVATSDAPFSKPGSDIVLKWSVGGGVTKVALSLDDPNWFKNHGTGSIGSDYPTSGTAELPFNCDPTDQPNTTHKYTLNTVGGGPTKQMTLTVTEQTSP